jgi:hypothetical protein
LVSEVLFAGVKWPEGEVGTEIKRAGLDAVVKIKICPLPGIDASLSSP